MPSDFGIGNVSVRKITKWRGGEIFHVITDVVLGQRFEKLNRSSGTNEDQP
jgi:hypothetical protein